MLFKSLFSFHRKEERSSRRKERASSRSIRNSDSESNVSPNVAVLMRTASDSKRIRMRISMRILRDANHILVKAPKGFCFFFLVQRPPRHGSVQTRDSCWFRVFPRSSIHSPAPCSMFQLGAFKFKICSCFLAEPTRVLVQASDPERERERERENLAIYHSFDFIHELGELFRARLRSILH